MSKWSDLAKSNPFKKDAEKVKETGLETADTMDEVHLDESAGMLDTCYIRSLDGREIPVSVDNNTRTVYPIRKKA